MRLAQMRRQEKMLAVLTRRALAVKARIDKRAWAVARRERTRHLIELGGLLMKAGLVELTDDDRATILGGLLILRDSLASDDQGATLELWRRRGKRAFDEDTLAKAGGL